MLKLYEDSIPIRSKYKFWMISYKRTVQSVAELSSKQICLIKNRSDPFLIQRFLLLPFLPFSFSSFWDPWFSWIWIYFSSPLFHFSVQSFIRESRNPNFFILFYFSVVDPTSYLSQIWIRVVKWLSFLTLLVWHRSSGEYYRCASPALIYCVVFGRGGIQDPSSVLFQWKKLHLSTA